MRKIARTEKMVTSLQEGVCNSFKWKFFVLVFLGLVVLPGKSFGEEFKSPQIVSRPALNVFEGNAFPTNPMIEDMGELKIAPGIFTFARKDDKERGIVCNSTQCGKRFQSEDGEGISLSFIHAFTPHIGVSIMGAYTQSKGSVGATGYSTIGATDSRKYSGPIQEKGGIGSVSLVLDPFSDPDGFRMPFMIGISYENITVDWDVPFIFTLSQGTTQIGHRGQDTGNFSISGFGGQAGFSLSFKIWQFRLSPFAFGGGAFNKPEYTWTVKNLDTGNSVNLRLTSDAGGIWGFGIPISFVPWGLTYTYIPESIEVCDGCEFNAHVLSWSKKW